MSDVRDAALRVEDLQVRYRTAAGPVTALHPVSFSVARGQMLGIAGESGSGKSTLALAVACLLGPDAAEVTGSVHVAGHELLSLAERQRRTLRWSKIAVVLQSAMNSLNPVLSIGAQIEDAITAHRAMSRNDLRARVAELLDLVHIPVARRDAFPHQLSGGMRQRAVIAMSLALQPDVILFDEPTTALDVVVQRQILEEVRRLQERFGFAAVFITHDLSLLLEVAHRVMVLYAGRVMEDAPADRFLGSALHPYSRGLLAATPRVRGPRHEVADIPGAPPDPRRPPPGCPFHPRCPHAGPRCALEVPELRVRAPSWRTACHWNDEPGGGARRGEGAA